MGFVVTTGVGLLQLSSITNESGLRQSSPMHRPTTRTLDFIVVKYSLVRIRGLRILVFTPASNAFYFTFMFVS